MALETEIAYFNEMKAKLLDAHEGQYVLIKGREIIGVFPAYEEAYEVGFQRFLQAPFLVKQIIEKEPTEQVPLLALHFQRAAIQ